MGNLRSKEEWLAPSHLSDKPRSRAHFLDSCSRVFHRDDSLPSGSWARETSNLPSFLLYTLVRWIVTILDTDFTFFFLKRVKGWTHSKFIVGILFSFPEWPGILELLHFVGPIVAGEKHGHNAIVSLLAARSDCSKSWDAPYVEWVSLTQLSQNWQSPPQWRLELVHSLILLCILILLSMNLFHSSQFRKVDVLMSMPIISCVLFF